MKKQIIQKIASFYKQLIGFGVFIQMILISKWMKYFLKRYWLVSYLLCLHLPSFAQPSDINVHIKDTIELNKTIEEIYLILDEKQEIDRNKVIAVLESSLLLKDTLTFFKFSKKIDFEYYDNKDLNEDGIAFLRECQRLLGNKPSAWGDFNNHLGYHFNTLEYKIEALDHYFKSIDWFKKYDSPNTTIPLGNVADIYYTNKNFDKALEYNELALSYSLKLENKNDKLYNIIFDYYRIGFIYHDLHDTAKAAAFFEKSLEASREFFYLDTKLLAIIKAITFYNKIENNEKCEELISEGNNLCDSTQVCQTSLGADFLLKKSEYYVRMGRFDKAMVPEDIQQENANLSDIYLYSANYYAKKGNIDKTREYYIQLLEENQKNDRKNKEGIYFNIEEKYLNTELKKKNQKLTTDIKSRERTSTIVLSVLLFIFSLLILQSFNSRRYKKLNDLLTSNKLDLEKSNRKLSKSNEELERFVFIASHDLKTPLRTIISFTQLLQNRLKTSEDAKTFEYLSFIKNGGIRLNDLIEDTLEYSKISHNDYEKKKEAVDLNELVHELLVSISGFIREKKAQITLQNRLPQIKAHRPSLIILFQNIIENGIKYNKSDIPIINIYFKEDEDFLTIHMEDNGIGIPEEYQDNVFNMFYRLHTHFEYKGSGLGLAICKRVIDQMNGKINIESKKGEGSIIELKFPANIICKAE